MQSRRDRAMRTAIDVTWNYQAVPMQGGECRKMVGKVDGHGLAALEPQRRPEIGRPIPPGHCSCAGQEAGPAHIGREAYFALRVRLNLPRNRKGCPGRSGSNGREERKRSKRAGAGAADQYAAARKIHRFLLRSTTLQRPSLMTGSPGTPLAAASCDAMRPLGFGRLALRPGRLVAPPSPAAAGDERTLPVDGRDLRLKAGSEA